MVDSELSYESLRNMFVCVWRSAFAGRCGVRNRHYWYIYPVFVYYSCTVVSIYYLNISLSFQAEKVEQQKKMEAEERMKKEDEERQLRKSRVAAIMSRTRGSKGPGTPSSKVINSLI